MIATPPRARAAPALAAAPIASLAFVGILVLTAIAVRDGLLGNDMLRLWEGAATAADGEVPFGRVVAAYPTLPFLATTLLAWAFPGTPAPALVSAVLFAIIAAVCFLSFRKASLPLPAAAAFTMLITFHPALLRAVIAGPGDMFLAAFALMLGLALYDLRIRSGTAEVMHVGLALMGLAFSHPMGAALAFAAMPFLAFALRPTLVANSALNVVAALVFPTFFAIGAFSYVSWIFPGDGWTFFAAPAESMSVWAVALARAFGDRLFDLPALDACLAMAAALVIGAPLVPATLLLVRRRRPLVAPALVLAAAAVAATALTIMTGFFGDPAAIVIVAPMLAAAMISRVPAVREHTPLATALLLAGWVGGLGSVALADPITMNRLQLVLQRGDSGRADALAAGGAAAADTGVLVDIDNMPAFLLGRGAALGILGPQSEPFTLAMLFRRIETPFVAVPDPHSLAGANDRLDRAFPALFRDGPPGYRLVYQNNTWRIFGKTKQVPAHKD
jgi:membrane protein XagC